MPTWTRDLGELQHALAAAGRECTLKDDQLVTSLATVTGRRRDVVMRRTPDLVEVLAMLPVRVPAVRETAFDVTMAEVNRRLAFPGLRRADDGAAAYVLRLWLSHDGTLDAQVVMDALAATQHVFDNYEPTLTAAAKGEAAHG